MSEPDNISLDAPPPPKGPEKTARVADGFKNRTKGEGLFNFGAYFGVGYLGVTGFSVFMTWLLRDFAPFAKHYDRLIDRTAESTGKMLKAADAAKHHGTVNSAMTIAALFLGGTIMSVLPIKWLEDNKASLVKKLDRFAYGKAKAENDPAIQQAHAELDAAPKQTWKSVFGSRVLAFAATLGTWYAMGGASSPVAKATQREAEGVVTRYGDSIDRHSARIGRWIDGALHHKDRGIVETINNARIAHPEGVVRINLNAKNLAEQTPHPDRVPSRVFSYIALDAFYSVITGGALYIFTRILAPVFDKHDRHPTAAPVMAPPPSTPSARPEATSRPGQPTPRIAMAESEGRVEGPQTSLAVS